VNLARSPLIRSRTQEQLVSTEQMPGIKPEKHFTTANPLQAPWVLVAGGFHRSGGMDKANLALAEYLVEQNTPVHLVCHSFDNEIALHPLVTIHRVPRPADSFLLGKPLLDICGRRVARKVVSHWPGARVLVNGENCLWPDINWVHCVHRAWEPQKVKGPLWFRAKHGLGTSLVRQREKKVVRIARVFISNSNRTSRDLVERLAVEPERVHTVYLGAESDWRPVTREERTTSRDSLKINEGRPLAVFVGSLGFDNNKGFDVLLEAWKRLCANPQWDVDLAAAGHGNALAMWREEVARCGLTNRIRMLGFTHRVRELLGAADVLVSPVRYEAYGLNVQEAICCGVPAIVSAGAGVAERYESKFAPLLLPDPEDVHDLVERLWQWRSNMEGWKASFREFGDTLRTYSWRDMARRMVSIVSQPAAAPAAKPARA
jgi:glycosyltransferase involved in cell wall biosynthesis